VRWVCLTKQTGMGCMGSIENYENKLILYDYTVRLTEWLTHTPNIDISNSKRP